MLAGAVTRTLARVALVNCKLCCLCLQISTSASALLHLELQVDLPEPEDEGGPKRRGGSKGGSVLAQRGEDKQLLELAGRRMQHAER